MSEIEDLLEIALNALNDIRDGTAYDNEERLMSAIEYIQRAQAEIAMKTVC